MKARVTIAILCFLIATLACGSSAPKTADDYVNEHGGNVEVYRRILSLNNCAELQQEFDQAEANLALQQPGTDQYKWGIGYMTAANDRMQALSCADASRTVPTSQPIAEPLSSTLPTATLLATFTPVVLPTLTKPAGAVIYISPTPLNTIVFVMPTRAPTRTGEAPEAPPPVQSVNCSCQFDTLNCENFSGWFDAQSCMDKCVSMGKGDIYRLDFDNDGIACESL